MVKGLTGRMRGLLGLLLVLGACNAGVYESLSRDAGDPVAESPELNSFKESNTVIVSWEADECADEYILERAEDNMVPQYRKVYSGRDLCYYDRNLPDEQRYLYRLKKRRGGKLFGPYEERLGVSSLVTEDEFEPNNRKEEAIALSTNPLIMNLYYYQSYGGLKTYDEDWYSVEIPPQRRLDIVIEDADIENDQAPTHFRLYEENRDSKEVLQLRGIYLENTEHRVKRVYFKIYPHETFFVSSMPEGAGGRLVRYKISVGQVMLLVP